jgi:NAD(P)-dependent dehydrogenase (short-subunit alcohol dehydrogenase family)/acyl carrier protein
MPGLPSVSPEMMGSLRTLRQIVEYLGGNGNRAQDAGDRSQVTSCRAQDAPHPEPRTTHLEPVLMQVVSQLTGYPAEMISPDMDIESDLGIDSIKRVEILSTLEERMPGLPSVSPEMMGSLRTLRQIAEYLGTNGDRSQVASGREMQKCNFCTPEQSPNPVLPSRNIVVAVESRFEPGERVNLPSGRQVLITDDGTGLAQAIADEFASLGIEAMIVSPKAQSREFSRSLTLPTQSRERERAESHLPQASGLVILSSRDADFQSQTASLKTAFALTHQLAQDMLDSAKQGGAVFATLTRLDGAFGFKGLCLENPVQGGLAGIVKTASVEWENVCCHAIDIAPDWNDNAAIAKAAVSEMLHRGPAEIGLSPGSRVTLALESSPYPEGEIQLVPGDVVVVSGGARGVTAAAAYALASLVKPVLALMGRSPAPSPEPEWLASLEDETEIKKAVFANEFSGNQASPKQLEKIFRAYMANREITRNIEKLKATGATVLYESLDVRDADAVKSLLDKIRSAYGPVKALIHGAGALEDRLIVDKTPEQFEKVFDTKVMGLKSLLDALPSEELKYLVLFSSVAARAGNKGQSDYAAANEVLNKIAQAESARRPNCRVISINWGPWDGGMVSPLLKREFERKGVKLIPLEAGASAMLQEMRGDKSAPVEVVIGAGLNPQAVGISCPPYAEQKLFLTFKRELDVANYPILSSHVLGGKPVVPFALMTEWLGHGALHGNPGLFLHGLDDIQILSGIKLDEGKKLIRLMAGKARKNSGVYEVDVEIRDGVKDNREVIHSKAKAILTAGPAAPPAFEIPKDMLSQAYPRSIQEAYDKILFHGIELQGIQKILSCSKRGMVAEVSAAPLPEKWMTQPLRSRWIADPLVLDSAFQMAILWCFEEKGLVCLPSYSATFRQYCDRFPSQGITAVLEVTETTQHKMKGDFTFLDAQNAVFAKITGYEAVMNDSLFEAFKNK